MQLAPEGIFDAAHPYPSFNVHDLHTVDNGVWQVRGRQRGSVLLACGKHMVLWGCAKTVNVLVSRHSQGSFTSKGCVLTHKQIDYGEVSMAKYLRIYGILIWQSIYAYMAY